MFEDAIQLSKEILEGKVEGTVDLIADNDSTAMILYVKDTMAAIHDWDSNEVIVFDFEDKEELKDFLAKVAKIAEAFEWCVFPLDTVTYFYATSSPREVEVNGTKVKYVEVPRRRAR